jgi:hypothetical protein
MAKLYGNNPKSVPKILRKESRAFRHKHPKTGKPFRAGGFYRTAADTIHVADHSVEYTLGHEMGHQVTMGHLGKMLGATKAKAFKAEIKKAFAAAQKRHVEPYYVTRTDAAGDPIRFLRPGTVGSVSDYGMSNIKEYMAEGFKWAMHQPAKFDGVDDELLRIMRKYLVTDKPASFDTVRGG